MRTWWLAVPSRNWLAAVQWVWQEVAWTSGRSNAYTSNPGGLSKNALITLTSASFLSAWMCSVKVRCARLQLLTWSELPNHAVECSDWHM
jgi:hypothetical protein